MKLRLGKLEIILTIIIAVLMIVIMTVTVVTLASNAGHPGKNLRDADPEPTPREIENLNKHSESKIAAYTGLGTIRCITAPQNDNPEDVGTAVVITPWLAYPEDDAVFYEELSRKRILITGIFTNYFSTRTKNLLLSTNEDTIKNDIMEEINSNLSLGQISKVYLTDYIFLE